MNALVVYFSQFGNTRQVAQAIASGLEPAASVRVLSLDQVSASDVDGIDLLVMGSPTHRMNLPAATREVIARLPQRSLAGKWVAAFDTSYRMSPWLRRFTAARKLARQLRNLGGREVVRAATFHVKAREGPLYDGEVERARDWAKLILRQAGVQAT